MKEITFILPGKDDKPVGGYKIVYEYANRFANADYKVNLIYHHIELDYKDRNLFLRGKRYFGFCITGQDTTTMQENGLIFLQK